MEKMSEQDSGTGSVGVRPVVNSRAAILEKLRKFFQSETFMCNSLRTKDNESQNSGVSMDGEFEMGDRQISDLSEAVQQIQAIENEEMEAVNAGSDRLETMTENCDWISDSLDGSFAATKYAEEVIREKTDATVKFHQDFACLMEKQTSTADEAEAINQDRSEFHMHLLALEKNLNEANDQLSAKNSEVNQKHSVLSREFENLQLLFTEFQNVKTSLEEVNLTNTTLEAENKDQKDTAEAMKEELTREQEASKEEEELEKEVLENASGVQVQIEENVKQRDSWMQQRSILTKELEGVYEQHRNVIIQLQDLREKMTNLTAVIQEKEKDVSEDDAELGRIREENQRLKDSEEITRQHVMDFTKQIDLQNEIHAETVAVLKDRDDQLKDSAQTVEIQNGSLKQMEEAAQKVQEYLENLELQYDTIRSDLAAEVEACECLNENVASLKNSLAVLVEEIEQQIHLEEELEKEPVVLKERLTFLEDQLSIHDHLLATKTALENEFASVMEDLETAVPKFNQLAEQKLAVQCEAEKCERDLQHCLETKEIQFQDLRGQYEDLRKQLNDLTELKETRSDSVAALNSTETEREAHIEAIAAQLQTVTSELAEKQTMVQDRKEAIKGALLMSDEKKIFLERKIGEMEVDLLDLEDIKRWVSRDLIQLEEQLKEQQEQMYPELMTEEETKEDEKVQKVQAKLRDLTSEVQLAEQVLEQAQLGAAESLDETEATNSSSEANFSALKAELAKLQLDSKELQTNLDNLSHLQSLEESKNNKLTKEVAKLEKKIKTTTGHRSAKDVHAFADYIQHEDNEIGELSIETKKLREMITISLGSEEKAIKMRSAKKKSVVAECEEQIKSMAKNITVAEQEKQKETMFRRDLDKLKSDDEELDNHLARILPAASEKTKELEKLQRKQQELKATIQTSIEKRERFEALKFKKPLPGKQASVKKQVGFQGLDRNSPDIIYGTDTEMETSQPLQRKSLSSVLKGNIKTSSR